MFNLGRKREKPVDLFDIFSFLSDGVLVYKNKNILYSNAEATLLLEQTNNSVIDGLQFDCSTKPHHQFEITLPQKEEKLIAHCMPIIWQDVSASLAIIKTEEEYTSLLESDINDDHHALHNRKRLDLLFKSAGDGYWEWHIPTACVFFSSHWKKMLGYEPEDIEPSFNNWINLIHADDLGNFLIVWSEYMENSQQQFSIEYRIKCQSGEYRWVEAHGIKDVNESDEIIRLAGFHRDINERKLNEQKLIEYQENLEQLVAQRTDELEQANKKLAELACQDPLTSLQNRRSFDENLDKQLRAAKRNNTQLCLLLMDIDHFKSFNDELGHQVGDDCIKSVANSIQHSISRPNDLTARFGGEEFVIILPDTDMNGAIKVSQIIQKNITELNNLPLNPFTKKQISLSIGISSNQLVENITSEKIIDLADKAMYLSKENGRDQICYLGDNLESASYILKEPLKKQLI